MKLLAVIYWINQAEKDTDEVYAQITLQPEADVRNILHFPF